MVDLESIYRRTLDECAPEHIVRRNLDDSMPTSVVAIGKCAGRMVDALSFERAFCVVPRGYPLPSVAAGAPARRDERGRSSPHVTTGGHPLIDDSSFAAGDDLLKFVDECEDILFLISGGGSACVEVPLPPFTREEIVAVNRQLVESSLTIGEINTVRKHLSAIKGGRLAARVHGRSVTLVYSDVAAGAISDVASGPTVADSSSKAGAARILERLGSFDAIVAKLHSASETMKTLSNATARVIADNSTLTSTAARFVEHPILIREQIETDVERAATMLADRASSLKANEVLIAGGEPTVARHGSGRGGRCCELAVRFAMKSDRVALFGTSDGVDGSSGVAAVVLESDGGLRAAATLEHLLANSESLAAANRIGRTIIIPPTGNNLRDLFLVSGLKRSMAQH